MRAGRGARRSIGTATARRHWRRWAGSFSSDALDAIADDAQALGTGARGLARLIGRAVDPVDYRWAELAEQSVNGVTITRTCLRGEAAPELRHGAPVEPRLDEELRREALNGLPPRPRPVHPAKTETKASALPAGLTDTRAWSDEELWNGLEALKRDALGWKDVTGSAKKWWETFEQENKHRPALVFRLAEELKLRGATIGEFFLAYVYSNTDNIQANLHYLDYQRLKARDEKGEKKP